MLLIHNSSFAQFFKNSSFSKVQMLLRICTFHTALCFLSSQPPHSHTQCNLRWLNFLIPKTCLRPQYKHTELGGKVEYLRLGWWRCKAEFLVRPESRQLQVQLYSKLRVGWKLCWGATFEQRLDNINVIASDKTLTAGWSFQYGWPWAGSSCPGWKGSTHPRKSIGSQRRHGLEVGTTYWPHGCKGTSSGSWRYRRWKRGWQTERKKEPESSMWRSKGLGVKMRVFMIDGEYLLTPKSDLIQVEMVFSLAHYKYEDCWFGNLSSLSVRENHVKSGKW